MIENSFLGAGHARDCASTGSADEKARPWVTVVMPAHNSAETIEAAIASVLAQTLDSFELIVVENGSLDDTYVMCEGWAARDGRVAVIHQDVASATAARNLGIERARGAYVAFLDADDVYLPGFLGLAHDLAMTHPDYGAFAIGGVRVNPDGSRARLSPELPRFGSKRLTLADAVRGGLYTDMTVVKVGVLRGLAGFHDRQSGDDYDLWLRLMAGGSRAMYVAAELFEIRTRENSRSSTRDEASYARFVDALIDSLQSLSRLELGVRNRRIVLRRIRLLQGRRRCIGARANLEERLLRGDWSRARRDYIMARAAYRVPARYLGGLLVMLCSPRLFRSLLMRRRRLGYG